MRSDLMRHPSRAYGSQAVRLVADIDHDPWGSVRASLYETARVVSLAPGLPGHEPRLTWLLEQQMKDGSWGEGPALYRLLPTLSAVEAFLSVARSDTSSGTGREQIAAAAAAGLAAVRNLPATGPWPDTAAIEILVPSLIAQINDHLGQHTIEATPSLGPWSRGPRLDVPHGFARRHEQVAQRCRSHGVPFKLHHTFEGIFQHVPPGAVPAPDGLLGSSPAATAAWLATTPASGQSGKAVAELRKVVRRYGGLFPEAAPLKAVERLWVAAALAGSGLPPACGATVRAWIHDIYDAAGVRGAPGLMPDADDTAMAVLVAALAGEPRDLAPLDTFWSGTSFDCYVGEDTGSVTANAHALQALHAYAQCRPAEGAVRLPRRDLVADWLLAQQQTDGAWRDKWHASPYYATERCVTALARHGGPTARTALRSAAGWVVATQRDDGSWGVWSGTAEETAYAVKILLAAQDVCHLPGADRALSSAEAVLEAASRTTGHRHPALWHDKTLYAPHAMIQAEVMAALQMLRMRGEAELIAPGGERDTEETAS
ncbi:prenyltransferase/squalene oxidase repeat-containing protein [Streptomyces ardesiacus]|uniref:prenyltransferase/squalene oxidase repeat-containing protein n=1 Tax=Streptomyces ardesiacus TaxID=285564 RepID=UPI00364C0B02